MTKRARGFGTAENLEEITGRRGRSGRISCSQYTVIQPEALLWLVFSRDSLTVVLSARWRGRPTSSMLSAEMKQFPLFAISSMMLATLVEAAVHPPRIRCRTSSP